MRNMYWQLEILGTISAFAYRHRETKKRLCRGWLVAGPSEYSDTSAKEDNSFRNHIR